MKKEDFRTWQKVNKFNTLTGVTISVKKKKISVWQTGNFSAEAKCSLKKFLAETDEFKLKELIIDILGKRIYNRIEKVASSICNF